MHQAMTLSELLNGLLMGGVLMVLAYGGLRFLATSSGLYR